MKVVIDMQAAVTQKAGVGRYARELAEHLAAIMPTDELVLSCFDFKRNAEVPAIPNAQFQPCRWIPGRAIQGAWNKLRFPPFNWLTGRADLYHFPNFIIPPLSTGKAVVTIHDLSFIRYPQFAEHRNILYLNRHIHKTAARADAIITISHFSAQEICTYLKVPAERVFPIHLGIDPRFRRPAPDSLKSTLATLNLNRPYLLTVGTVEPRKNIPHLVRVFEAMQDFDGDLVIAGGNGWKMESILERIRTSPRAASIKLIGYTGDDTLPALYAGAEVFLLPSFYEGFGFPPVEAMACGTPVVSSTGGSLSEVLGDGAVLLNHFEIDGWTEAIRQVLGDSEFRQALVVRGHAKAASYTWQTTAQKTLDVFRQVVQ